MARLAFAIVGSLLLLGAGPLAAQGPKQLEVRRNKLVDEEIIPAGIKDARVIKAMRETPRHEFVPLNQRDNAYFDMSLPIGDAQTISAPFIVAYMTEQLDPQPTDKVLEIGTGSGYQAAVLSPLVKEVYTIEIVQPLGERAAKTLKRLKYDNVHVKVGDGYQGWPDHAPFDKIIVTCSPEEVPPALTEQLKEGGRMLIPVGERYQQVLYSLEKKDGELVSTSLLPTLFVPMTGAAESQRRKQPDPMKPELVNGSFEEFTEQTRTPVGWYHPRQVEVVDAADSPAGDRYARFSNSQAGRDSHVLQGFAVDGRRIRYLNVSLWVRGSDIGPGQSREQLPMLRVNFFDAKRGAAGPMADMGPWRVTSGWRHETARIPVPANTREAIVQTGLMGATGTLEIDDVRIEAE